MEAGGSAQLESLADESVSASMAFLSSGSLLSLSVACTRFLAAARADILWLPVAGRRWRFGAGPTSAAALPPGARDRASESAMAEAAREPLLSKAGVHAFFLRRCRQDAEVATLALQLNAARMGPGARSGDLQPGAVVRIVGLASDSAAKYNGAHAVISEAPSPSADEERFAVTLPLTMKSLRIKGQNLSFVGPCLSEEEAERRVLAAGAEAVDALARLTAAAPAGSCLEATARHLLATASEQWAVQQWQLLLADACRVDLLEEGGLVLAQWGEPGRADVAAVRSRLAEIAGAVAARTTASAPLSERIEAVSAVLFEEWGFGGDVESYFDPRNSFLHCVLERRRGIPISLSILWVAVARRVDVPCFLCAHMPMHILIRVTMGKGDLQHDLFVDAFNRKIMKYDEMLEFANRLGLGRFEEEYVAQRPATSVYARLLRNLTRNYTDRGKAAGDISAWQSLVATCSQAITIAAPGTTEEVEQLKILRQQVREGLKQMRAAQREQPHG